MSGSDLNIEQRVLDRLGWGVVVIGRWSRKILAYNRRMEEITGIPADAALNRGMGEVFGHVQGLDLEAFDAELRETGTISPRSLRLVRPGGEVVYRHVRGDTLDGAAGGEEAVIGSVQDVTEQEWTRKS